MARIDSRLQATLRSAPEARMRVIVRTEPPAGQYKAAMAELGLHVVRVSTLINAVTVEGPAKTILTLSLENWVVGLEPDGPVHTMGK